MDKSQYSMGINEKYDEAVRDAIRKKQNVTGEPIPDMVDNHDET